MTPLLAIASELDPGAAEPYLRAHGWELVHQGQLGNRWRLRGTGRARNVAVPLRDLDEADQARMFAAVLEVLADVERREPALIARDLSVAAFDVVEFRLIDEHLVRGEIPLRAAPELTGGALHAMQAAARTVITPRAHFVSGTLPAPVQRFVEDAVLAGTDRGSVILRIRAPALEEPQPQTQIDGLTTLESFGRRAVLQLLGGVNAAKDATHRDFAAMDMDRLDRDIDEGLSANLCDALLHLSGGQSGLNARIGLRVRWALTQPTTIPASRVEMDEEEIGQLEAVADILKKIEPIPNRTIVGPVVQVRRPPNEPVGTAIIEADIDGKPRRVRIQLDPSDYEIAARANVERTEIRATGTLESAGTIRELTNPTRIEPA